MPQNKEKAFQRIQESAAPSQGAYPATRLRRLRSAAWIRDMVQEHRVSVNDLIWPVFVIDGKNERQDISSMPGVARWTIALLVEEIKQAADCGIKAVALFPITPTDKKTMDGREAANADNLMCRAIAAIKQACPHVGIITDVALDPYTTHGHDGLLEDGRILNDETVEILCRQSLVQAQAGADIIAPSDMMDGRVAAIRGALDGKGFQDTMILSYAAKYASAFYGPFKDAVQSAAAFKSNNILRDKKTYQMNPANSDEALREVEQDIKEGTDIVMVKPGLPYLDVIARVKATFNIPTFAYHVSGEYAMLRAAAEKGWLDYESTLAETLLSFKRAGADGVLTYAARDYAKLLRNS
ncbi:MAG: porphobilinogen synthase [Alphaproteobacteria bacterium]